MNIFNNKKSGFTLAELLLTLIIVGIIAAVVMPTLITRAQNRMFETAYQREIADLTDTLEALAVNEGVYNFSQTSMGGQGGYISVTDIQPGGDSGAISAITDRFYKRFVNTSKICNKKECFADSYMDANRQVPQVQPFDDSIHLKGIFDGVVISGCKQSVLLKNGMSLCIIPVVLDPIYASPIYKANVVTGFIDVNGVKGPNIIGRDFRSFEIEIKNK